MNKNLIIVTHRRSGTHLTLDTLINNVQGFNKKKLIVLNENYKLALEKIEYFNKKKIPVLIKTHYLPQFDIYIENQDFRNKINLLFFNSNIIYVYRNGLDVMVSLFEFMKKFDEKIKVISFKEFLMTKHNFDKTSEEYNRIQFWKFHIESWERSIYSNKILFLKYEDLNLNYEKTIQDIANKFELKLKNKIIDIRLKKYKFKNRKIRKLFNLLKGRKTTSVSARKGIIGDYKNYFDDDSYKEFLKENSDLLKKLNYELTDQI